MKVWPIDPLVPRNLRLEVPEKLPQGLISVVPNKLVQSGLSRGGNTLAMYLVLGMLFKQSRGDTESCAPERSVRYRPCNNYFYCRAYGTSYSRLQRCLGLIELACGSQAFIATLLFDPSMSALPIIPKQNSVSVGLFTH